MCKTTLGIKRHQKIGKCIQIIKSTQIPTYHHHSTNTTNTTITSSPSTTTPSTTQSSSSSFPFEFPILSTLPVKNIPYSLQDIFCDCVERLCKAYINTPNDINMFYILCLPKITLSGNNNNKIKQQLIQYPSIDFTHLLLILIQLLISLKILKEHLVYQVGLIK